MLTIKEVAARLRLGQSTVYELMARGRLGYHTFGARRLVGEDQLAEYVASCRVDPKAAEEPPPVTTRRKGPAVDWTAEALREVRRRF